MNASSRSTAQHAGDAARRAGTEHTVGLPVPGLGAVHLSAPQLAYVGGVVVLAAAEVVSWPVGLLLAAGHLLAADRDSRTLQGFGEALEEAA
jgi:hypothetical protein